MGGREAGLAEQLGEPFGGDEMALLRRCRPRDREMKRSTGAGGHVPQREATARCKDAMHLGVEPALVRDVHLNVLAEHDVEGRVVEWELRDVGREDLDHVAEPDGVVEPFGDVAVLGREIDRCDTGTLLGRDQAGGPADSGAGIEDTVAGADVHEVDERGGGEAAEAMEVLEHRKLGRLHRVDVLAGRRQRPFDIGARVAGGVGLFGCGSHGLVSSQNVVDAVHNNCICGRCPLRSRCDAGRR